MKYKFANGRPAPVHCVQGSIAWVYRSGGNWDLYNLEGDTLTNVTRTIYIP